MTLLSYAHTHKRLLAASVTVMLGIALMFDSAGSNASEPTPAAPAIPVTTHTLEEKPVQVWSAFSGRIYPVDAAEVRPEVSGRIVSVRFQDGKHVKAGEVLFVIEPGPYEAAVSKAEADLASAQTQARFASLELRRASAMIKTKAIAQRIFDERANASRIADASVKAARAQLKNAKIDLDRAYVKSPISGRTGRVEITEGNVVQAGPGAPVLTTVVANDAVYADFEVDEQTYTGSIRRNAEGRASERKIPVKLTLQSDPSHAHEGTIYSFDNHLDVTSGTIRARAKFDNKDGTLLPGMFVSVSMAGSGEQRAVVVPEEAIGFDQSKKFVYAVDDKNTVVYKEVTLGDKLGAGRIVLGGIAAGERVIVNGLQHVRPGAPVQPTDAQAVPPADTQKTAKLTP